MRINTLNCLLKKYAGKFIAFIVTETAQTKLRKANKDY